VNDLLSREIENIVVKRFLSSTSGIGKTSGMIENVKSFIDEVLMFKSDFEVCVICCDLEQKKILRTLFTDHYLKYIELKTMQEIMYKLSEFPINLDAVEDVPSLNMLRLDDKHYEKFFVEPQCYVNLLQRYLDKVDKIKEILC